MHVTDMASVPRDSSPYPGGAMPEHGHGDSSVTLVPFVGTVEVTSGGATRTLAPGSMAHIPAGDRVAVANPGQATTAFMVTLSPSTAEQPAA